MVEKLTRNPDEGKGIMSGKDHVQDYIATATATSHLTQPYNASGRCIIGDSWIVSVKSASERTRWGFYSIMLVKTAHEDFPRQLIGEEPLQCGEWKAYTTSKDGVKLQACRFRDLKVKDFISTCSSVIQRLPKKTKYHGEMAQPKVAEEYLKYASAIDIRNH